MIKESTVVTQIAAPQTLQPVTVPSYFLVHGWAMWTTWTIIGLTQIASSRYLKHHWRLNMWIHRFGGALMLLVTLLYGIGGYIRI